MLPRRLRRRPLTTAVLTATILSVMTPAFADPPEGGGPGGEGRPRPGRLEGGPGRPPRGEGRPGGGQRGPGGLGGGGSPERFVEHALSFDADADGKLDRTELEAFAKDFHERRRGGPGGPGGERPQRPPRPD